ncbi:MAG TPA: AAA family ATPase, partial [Solirubrobacterales bacterium]
DCQTLAARLRRPLDLGTVIEIAVGAAAALAEVHRHGIVHRDIKPEHILLGRADDDAVRVKLTGLGIASRTARERTALGPLEAIPGTFQYMAPEQTGRMNRSVDSRSDLYSLGVVFYEMLTGSLPFAATDPAQWVHAHTALQPVEPRQRVADIPEPLSAIAMKLLAKAAEDRYQTADGLRADLERCAREWREHGAIAPFALGERDIPDRWVVPERLYGRSREVEALHAAFGRVARTGTPELVIVTGYSGAGKSALVHELPKALTDSRSLFAAGKLDEYRRLVPYGALAQAIDSMVEPLLGRGEAEFDHWRTAISRALAPNGRLLTDLAPRLRLVIGEQPEVPDLDPRLAKARFHLVFRRFAEVFATAAHPLALFIDDMHWLDPASLDVVEDLLLQPGARHLLLIGAYRDNEVGPDHPLARKLAAVRASGARVHEVALAPLPLADVTRLAADALHCEADAAAPLAELVHEKTAGNPFFVLQFLTALAEEGLVAFDHAEQRWRWDLAL